jgi:hypothetical protein
VCATRYIMLSYIPNHHLQMVACDNADCAYQWAS